MAEGETQFKHNLHQSDLSGCSPLNPSLQADNCRLRTNESEDNEEDSNVQKLICSIIVIVYLIMVYNYLSNLF